MAWTVTLHPRVAKGVPRLPKRIQEVLELLLCELEEEGPVRGTWPNYGKLAATRHHCHLKKGRPTYVAVWDVRDNKLHVIEVMYVGTHENAPY
jgi:mRNA-degrading endonuclease RelE of RelBE toxin-antitoxin system